MKKLSLISLLMIYLTVTVVAYRVTVELQPGWNTISVPFEDSNMKIADLYKVCKISSRPFVYSPNSNGFIEISKKEQLLPNKIYTFSITTKCTLTFEGTKPAFTLADLNANPLVMQGGKTYPLPGIYPEVDLANIPKTCNVTVYFLNGGREYKTTNKIKPGYGYFITSTEECIFGSIDTNETTPQRPTPPGSPIFCNAFVDSSTIKRLCEHKGWECSFGRRENDIITKEDFMNAGLDVPEELPEYGCILNCGTCNAGECCKNHKCLRPLTCNDLNYECGTYREPNCGIRIDCGTCPEGICKQGKCCVPQTCEELGYECGIVTESRCGTRINCGSCPADKVCVNFRCIDKNAEEGEEQYTYTFESNRWHFISIPVESVSFTVGKIKEACGEYTLVYKVTYTTSGWKADGPLNPYTRLIPGEAYFLKTYENCEITVKGKALHKEEYTITIPPRGKVIGAPFEKVSLEEIAGDCDINKLELKTYQGNGWKDTNILEPGKGYYIKNNGPQCTLRYITSAGDTNADTNQEVFKFHLIIGEEPLSYFSLPRASIIAEEGRSLTKNKIAELCGFEETDIQLYRIKNNIQLAPIESNEILKAGTYMIVKSESKRCSIEMLAPETQRIGNITIPANKYVPIAVPQLQRRNISLWDVIEDVNEGDANVTLYKLTERGDVEQASSFSVGKAYVLYCKNGCTLAWTNILE